MVFIVHRTGAVFGDRGSIVCSIVGITLAERWFGNLIGGVAVVLGLAGRMTGRLAGRCDCFGLNWNVALKERLVYWNVDRVATGDRMVASIWLSNERWHVVADDPVRLAVVFVHVHCTRALYLTEQI